ncbi:MAG: hypothetical protein KDA52_19435 [Planctomycetaceae bacterium]|nr:hypothetical protein [Planctomycetaceae bacterium]
MTMTRNVLLLTLLLIQGMAFPSNPASAQSAFPIIEQSVDEVDWSRTVNEEPVNRFRKQALQAVIVSGGYLASTRGDLNQSFIEASLKLGVPLGNFENILGVTPSFRVDFLDPYSGLRTDVPAELFETGVSFFYRRPLTERLSVMGIVRPSIRSDFTTSQNAFRLFGLGLVNWECIPDELTLSAGAVFLDRADLPLLPAVGLTWTPQPTLKADLQFPTSKLSFRIAKDGNQSETWSYLSAGIGGNTWAVTRASNLSDELTLREMRLVLGVDHLTDGGGGYFAEVGFLFNRRIEYQVDQSQFGLSDGIVLQAGWRF